MVNKCVKFQWIFFNTFKVVAKVKVCHNDDNNDYAAAAADDNTRLITIPQLSSLKKSQAKNEKTDTTVEDLCLQKHVCQLSYRLGFSFVPSPPSM